jgi:hypothetical protein
VPVARPLIEAKKLGEAAARLDSAPDGEFRGAFAAAVEHGYERGSAEGNAFVTAYLSVLTHSDDLRP